jgi:hypothetical protein
MYFSVYIVYILLSVFISVTLCKSKDPRDNKGNIPFFLQDPSDEMCLGPNGFTVCNEQALWILTKRQGKKTFSLVSLLNISPNGLCLENKVGFFGGDKVGMGACSSKGSMMWEFEFVDSKHVKISSRGMTLVRGKPYKTSVSMQSVKKGQFISFYYHPTPVHDVGVYLKSTDGTCFDGDKFRECINRNSLLWGIGVKYSWGKAYRYIFNFKDRDSCILAKGDSVYKGPCKDSKSLGWALENGKMTFNNGKLCVVRKTIDNSTSLTPCGNTHEYITVDIPLTYT